MDNLLPCPFCGSNPSVGGWPSTPMIRCNNGKCPASKKAVTVEIWNTRITHPPDAVEKVPMHSCFDCDGTGSYEDHKCPTCGGTGKLPELVMSPPDAVECPLIIAMRFTDNGEVSHWDVIIRSTGVKIATYPLDELPDAVEWRGPWKCDKCGWRSDDPLNWHDEHDRDCTGKPRPHDRRAPRDGTERRKGEAGELVKAFRAGAAFKAVNEYSSLEDVTTEAMLRYPDKPVEERK